MKAIYLTSWAVVALLLLPPFCLAQESLITNLNQQRRISVKTRHAALLLAVSLLAGLTVYAGEKWKDPYIGEWSNGRGDTLVITSNTIRFGNDKAVNYHDITRVTNGKEFS